MKGFFVVSYIFLSNDKKDIRVVFILFSEVKIRSGL